MKRRDFLEVGARAALCTAVLPLAGVRAAVARSVEPTLEAALEALLAEGAALHADRDLPVHAFQRAHGRLVRRAEGLARRHPDRVSAWYVAARCHWVDIAGEIEELHALDLLDEAIALDPGHLPSVVLARHIADFIGSFDYLEGSLLDQAVEWAERIARLTGNHPAALGLLRAQREFRWRCSGPGDCLARTLDELRQWQQLEEEIRHRRWDGISVAALPLW